MAHKLLPVPWVPEAKQMKPKVAAIIVITILTISMVLTVVAAVDLAIRDESTGTSSIQQAGQDSRDGSLVRSLKFVCPFH